LNGKGNEFGTQKGKLVIIVASIAGILTFLAIISAFALLWRRKKQSVKTNHNKVFRNSPSLNDPDAAKESRITQNDVTSGEVLKNKGAERKSTQLEDSELTRESYAFSVLSINPRGSECKDRSSVNPEKSE
jgi:hypothetical protein